MYAVNLASIQPGTKELQWLKYFKAVFLEICNYVEFLRIRSKIFLVYGNNGVFRLHKKTLWTKRSATRKNCLQDFRDSNLEAKISRFIQQNLEN